MAAQGSQQGVRTLAFNNVFQKFYANRLNINTVGNMHVGHDGCRVGVNQYNLQAFFLQGTAGLGAGIVELSSLTDDNGAGTDNEHLFNIS